MSIYVHLCVFACAIEMFVYICDAEISKHFHSGKMVGRLLKDIVMTDAEIDALVHI